MAESMQKTRPAHEGIAHRSGDHHHHHSHAATSRHVGDHHLLQVEDLCVSFTRYDDAGGRFFAAGRRQAPVLDRLSLAVHAGEVVAIARVPQSVAALDPLMRVGRQVQGAAPFQERTTRKARQEALFERYGLGPETAQLYPHELSGGMARRVLLCCALMGSPQLVIADEPTVGLDLDRVAVFRDGTVVEETAVASFASPELLQTPYARALWHALPEHCFEAREMASC